MTLQNQKHAIEKQQDVGNLYFIMLEDKNKVPFTFTSSCNVLKLNCDDNDDNNDKLDDEMSKLALKCRKLILKKNF